MEDLPKIDKHWVYGGYFPCPEWPVASANDVMHRRADDIQAAQSLAGCPALTSGGLNHSEQVGCGEYGLVNHRKAVWTHLTHA
jgi:hypothetical protein